MGLPIIQTDNEEGVQNSKQPLSKIKKKVNNTELFETNCAGRNGLFMISCTCSSPISAHYFSVVL